jgi:NAD-dependent dihydropyrimidine dehydrogenase PreA subunit
VKEFLLDILQLFFRMIPHPTRPRLIVFGTPDRKSLVMVTVNSSLTVRRLSKALKDENCYLLVAPAGGINVWCGSVGGHFTIESIISIIKTSGIERLVDHRRLILPQLSAPTITSKELNARAGWSAQFGPIRADDIPEYLRNGKRVTTAMTEIRYSSKDRLEMAIAMSGSIIVRYSLLPLLIFGLWGMSRFGTVIVCTSAILHLFNEKLPGSSNTRKALSISPLIFLLLLAFSWATGGSSIWQLFFLTLISLSAAVLVGSAHSGYTPFKQCSYSRQFYGYPPLEIDIVAEDCTGCTLCDWVCPVDCFAPVRQNTKRTIFVMANPTNCVECGACLVQCPTNAVVNLFEVSKEQSHLRCA